MSRPQKPNVDLTTFIKTHPNQAKKFTGNAYSSIPSAKPIYFGKKLEKQYEDLGISYYANKKQYREHFGKDVPENLINQSWLNYLHRDTLIASGQYGIVRALDYRKNYLSKYKDFSGYDPELYAKMDKMAINDFMRLIMMKENGKQTKAGSRVLPSLSIFYLESADQITHINKEIERALNKTFTGNEYNQITGIIEKAKELKLNTQNRAKPFLKNLNSYMPYIPKQEIKSENQKDRNMISNYVGLTIQLKEVNLTPVKVEQLATDISAGRYKEALFSSMYAREQNYKKIYKMGVSKKYLDEYPRWKKQQGYK